jgi:uncharacterized C2H2 Zn-finger protein
MFEESPLHQNSYPLFTRQPGQPELFSCDRSVQSEFTTRIPSRFPAGVNQNVELRYDENSLTETESDDGEMDTNDSAMVLIAAASESALILPTFGRPNTLKKSVVKAFKSKTNFNCSICDNSFTNNEQFSRHERLHRETPELLFNCSYCRKSFARNDYLTRHERIHTGEKPFSCSFCDKAFHQSSNLIVHERTHTGERPFACPLCDKSFINSSNRATHMKTHNLNWEKKENSAHKKLKS